MKLSRMVVISGLVLGVSAPVYVGPTGPVAEAAGTGELQLISTNAAGVKADRGVLGRFVASDDGSRVLFASNSTNLPSGGMAHVYLKNLTDGSILLVDSTSAGVPANGDPGLIALSSNGRFAAFTSEATNLSPLDSDTRQRLVCQRPVDRSNHLGQHE